MVRLIRPAEGQSKGIRCIASYMTSHKLADFCKPYLLQRVNINSAYFQSKNKDCFENAASLWEMILLIMSLIA